MDETIAHYRDLVETLLQAESYRFDDELIENLDSRPGVYRVYENGSQGSESLFVGKSMNLQRRIVMDHFKGRSTRSEIRRKLLDREGIPEERLVTEYLQERCQVQCITLSDPRERAMLEHFAVAVLQPRLND